MKIKSAFLKAEISLDPIFKMEEIDNKKILECLKQSWEWIWKFSKNIDLNATNYYQDLLENICSDDIPLNEEIMEEARDYFKLLKAETDVKSYIRYYFKLLSTLLIFNQPYKEGCDICQAVLFYYFDEETKTLFKKCSLCGNLLFAITGERASSNLVIKIRPAKKIELRSIFN